MVSLEGRTVAPDAQTAFIELFIHPCHLKSDQPFPPQVLDMNVKFKFTCGIILLMLQFIMPYMAHDVYMFKHYVQLFTYMGNYPNVNL